MKDMPRMTIDEARANNIAFVGAWSNKDSAKQEKIAANSNEYMRMMVRTDGILRSLFPSEPITANSFDRQRDTDDAVVVRNMQTDSAGAFTVPFTGAPQRQTIRAPRYAITIERILTTMYGADELQIVTYDTPIVEMKTDLLKKDFLAQEDRQLVGQVDASCGVMYTGDNASTVRNTLHYKRTKAAGFLGLDNVATGQEADSFNARRTLLYIQTAMSYNKPTTAACSKLLMNSVTYELWKFLLTRNTAGGDMAQAFVFEAGEYETLGTSKVVRTLNRNLVADNVIYLFTAPNYLGSFLMYQDITLEIKHEAFFFSFFAHGVEGLAIANLACAKKVKLGGWTGSGTPDWAVTAS